MNFCQNWICKTSAVVLGYLCFAHTVANSQTSLAKPVTIPALEVGLDWPYCLVRNGKDILYVGDGTGLLREFDVSSGLMSDYLPSSKRLFNLSKLLMTKSGQILAADPGDCQVVEIATDGTVNVVAGGKNVFLNVTPNNFCGSSGEGGPATEAQFEPDELSFDSAGDMVIVNSQQRRLSKVNHLTGIINTLVRPSQLTGTPGSIALNRNGDLYISQVGKGTGRTAILRLDHQTGLLVAVDGRNFSGPKVIWSESEPHRFVYSDPTGDNLYAADLFRIFYIDLTKRRVSLIAGRGQGFAGDGGPATLAKLDMPSGIAFDSQGNLYFADYTNCRIRKIDAKTHIITTVAGRSARLKRPGDEIDEEAITPTTPA